MTLPEEGDAERRATERWQLSSRALVAAASQRGVIAAAATRTQPLQAGGGGGTSGGMDAWQQSVEDRLEGLGKKLDNRFMWLLAAFASGFILLATLVLNRTDVIASRIDGVGERLAKVEALQAAAAQPVPAPAGPKTP